MATATGPVTVQDEERAPGAATETVGAHRHTVASRTQFRCACGHMLRVSGGGRHRIYFEPENVRLDDPVMDGRCPSCGRGLPGKQ